MPETITTSAAYSPVLDRRNELPDFVGKIPSDFVPPARRRRVESVEVESLEMEMPTLEVSAAVDSQQAWIPLLGLAGLGIVVLAMFLALIDVPLPLDIVAMFCGAAIYSLANYIGYRFRQAVWIGPALSARLFLASLALACTAGVAGLTS